LFLWALWADKLLRFVRDIAGKKGRLQHNNNQHHRQTNIRSIKNTFINELRLLYRKTPSTVIPVFSRRPAWIEERC